MGGGSVVFMCSSVRPCRPDKQNVRAMSPKRRDGLKCAASFRLCEGGAIPAWVRSHRDIVCLLLLCWPVCCGRRFFDAETPGHLTPEQAARQLLRGVQQDHFIIDTHPGMAKALFGLRGEYINTPGPGACCRARLDAT